MKEVKLNLSSIIFIIEYIHSHNLELFFSKKVEIQEYSHIFCSGSIKKAI
jgi:hypothetical protein